MKFQIQSLKKIVHELGEDNLFSQIQVDENPLENLKVLYGTGAVKLNDETRQVERVGGVEYTIKDGIVYDAKALLKDVEQMVEKQKTFRESSSTQMKN